MAKIEKLERKIDQRLPWIPIENLHLTLVFLGWLEEEYVEKVTQLLRQLKAESLNLMVEKIDYSPGAKRMIWLYLGSNPKLLNLQSDLVRLWGAQKFPFEKEKREYLPHINLIRLQGTYGKNIKQALGWKLEAEEVNLYESILTKPFARYEVLKSVRLD